MKEFSNDDEHLEYDDRVKDLKIPPEIIFTTADSNKRQIKQELSTSKKESAKMNSLYVSKYLNNKGKFQSNSHTAISRLAT